MIGFQIRSVLGGDINYYQKKKYLKWIELWQHMYIVLKAALH